ncbi:MAG TPA: hypothetical protein VM534_04295, partial [Thermoanaerobaculia bacterium]|nr:hypothetical protein [Thermoanaerobaculia bacterium]
GPGFALDLIRRLGMEAAPTGEGIEVTVPTWRGDLGEETDLIEEVLRFHGYDRIPAALPRLTTGDVRHIPLQDLEESVRDLLSGCGLTELITYSFIHPEVNELFSREAPANIGNALTENLASMRLSLLPGLLEAVHHNLSYGTRDGGVFEVGRRYPLEEGGIVERSTAAFVLFGQAAPHWSDPRRAADYFDAKGIVETIAARFHVALEVRAAEPPWGLEGQSAEAIAGERVVARLGTVSREVLRKMGVKANVIAGEIDLEALLASTGGWQMEEVSRHPGVPMVLPLLHDRNLDYGTIIAQVERADVPWLKEVGLWDRYTPEGSDQIKTTLAMWYQALDRSLTQEEVADTHQRLTRILTEALPVRVAE